jgi:hypothetical protein
VSFSSLRIIEKEEVTMKHIKSTIFSAFVVLFSSHVFAAQWKLSHEVEAGNFKKLCVYTALNGSREIMEVEVERGQVCRIYI